MTAPPVKELSISELNPALNATLVSDAAGLELVGQFLSRVTVVGTDTETNVVRTFFHRKIRTIQLGNRDEQYVIDLLPFAGSTQALIEGQGRKQTSEWAKPIAYALRDALLSPDLIKVGHNIQFDYEVLRWCLGLRTWGVYDTQLAEKVIYCGRVHFFAKDFWMLHHLVARYCKLKVNKELQKSFDLETPLTQEQIAYAALDTRLALAVRAGQLPVVEKSGLARAVRLENEALPSFGDMKLNGFYLDKDDWMEVVRANDAKHVEHVKALDTFFMSVVGGNECPLIDMERLEKEWKDCPSETVVDIDKVTGEKFEYKTSEKRRGLRQAFINARRVITAWKKALPTFEGEAAINYASTDQVLAALHKMGFTEKELPDTNDITLEALSDRPVIKALQDYRSTSKQQSTYGEEFLKNIDPDTGRIHSNMNQLGAATGRTSSSAPNMQNITKGSSVRGCFKARPGYKLVIVDMAGAELRLMAELSGEPSWLAAFEKNWDVHSMGAEMMFSDGRWVSGAQDGCVYLSEHGKCNCKGHKALREYCKAVNFKVAYGGQDLSGTLKITKKESDKILALWSSTFSVLSAYLNKSGEDARNKMESRTLSGRRRLYSAPTWEAAKVNAHAWAIKNGKDPHITQKQISRAHFLLLMGIERQGKNTPFQGGNVDVAKAALSFLWYRVETEFGAEIVGFVHDELIYEVPEENAEPCKVFVQDCIRRGGAEFMKRVTMESEGNISERWLK